MKHMGLFEGIGGFSLAARWAGWITPVMVEWNTYCQAVLRKNFPDATIFSDIRNFDGRPYAGQIDVITGGFPCQPFSHAGKRAGTADDRYLWPEMLRVIREVGPEWVVGENVAGLLTMDGGRVLQGILADLENAGYRPEIYLIPALAIGAPHRRDRLWIVAHRNGIHSNRAGGTRDGRAESATWHAASAGEATVIGIPQGPPTYAVGNGARNRHSANADCPGWETHGVSANGNREIGTCYAGHFANHWYEVATRICGMDDGFPGGVDGVGEIPAKKSTGKASRLEALGNAIVPQIAYQIFEAINEAAQ